LRVYQRSGSASSAPFRLWRHRSRCARPTCGINLKTATTLGFTVLDKLLATADEVIE
jgi:hypothetical protein